MATTHFTGPIESAGGFIGNLTGGVVQAPVVHAVDGAISPSAGTVTITKGSAAAMTVSAPGAANVGKYLTIIVTTTFAHVVVVTGLVGGTTLTFSTAGENVTLYASSPTAWILTGNPGGGAVQSA